MNWFSKSADDVLNELDADPAQGLSDAEAKTRLEKHGANKLRSEKKKSVFLIFIALNAILGVVQEVKAKKAIDALLKLSNPKALVRRNSVVVEIDSEMIVIGDILILDAGRIIAADMRLIESIHL